MDPTILPVSVGTTQISFETVVSGVKITALGWWNHSSFALGKESQLVESPRTYARDFAILLGSAAEIYAEHFGEYIKV